MKHTGDDVTWTYSAENPTLMVGAIGQNDARSPSAFTWNRNRDVALLLEGELYAESERTTAATQADLLAAYEADSLAFLSRLNGWFHGLIIDHRNRKMVLFNDRFGVGRICYHQDAGTLYFASEAKSLLAVLPQTRSLHPTSLAEQLSCGAVLQNRTLFHDIALLPPGSAWTTQSDGTLRRASYFQSSSWEAQPPLTEPEYYQKLKEIWVRRLPQYFAGTQSIALSLTGGIDSRMILAWRSQISQPLVSYTFGSKYRECHDVNLARRLARLCQVPHAVIALDRAFLDQFQALATEAAYTSDGTLDATGAVDVFVQHAARQFAAVRVTGTNGGEILRRIVAFNPAPLAPGIFQPELVRALRVAGDTYRGELTGHRLSFTAFKQVPWYMNSKFAVERRYLTLRMPYFDNEVVALSYQAPPSLAESNKTALQLIAEGDRNLASVATDRGSSHAALRPARFAAARLHQFTYNAEYAYDYGMPQWLARVDHAVAPLHLERLFLGRHKVSHFRVWYRDELSACVREILLDDRSQSRPYLCRSGFRRMIEEHLAGRQNHTREINKLLALELAQRTLLESN